MWLWEEWWLMSALSARRMTALDWTLWQCIPRLGKWLCLERRFRLYRNQAGKYCLAMRPQLFAWLCWNNTIFRRFLGGLANRHKVQICKRIKCLTAKVCGMIKFSCWLRLVLSATPQALVMMGEFGCGEGKRKKAWSWPLFLVPGSGKHPTKRKCSQAHTYGCGRPVLCRRSVHVNFPDSGLNVQKQTLLFQYVFFYRFCNFIS